MSKYKEYLKESTKFKTLQDAGKYAKSKFGSGFVAMGSDFMITWFKHKPLMSTGRNYSVDPSKLSDQPAWKFVGTLDASKYPSDDMISV